MEKDQLVKNMIEQQLTRRGIKNFRVLDAFRRVPRHLFVPEHTLADAYEDHPLPIGDGQTISQPYIVALMTEALELTGTEKVLEIGTGSGYQTAILAELAQEVYSIERIVSLAKRAQKVLAELGYLEKVHLKIGDGSRGWPEEAPFDAILVAAGTEKVPPALLDQLSSGGRLVIPVGSYLWSQSLDLYLKTERGVEKQHLCGCRFVPLLPGTEESND